MLFRYRKSIDHRIKPAVERVLRVRVLGVSKINSGEVNHVYKVQLQKKNVLVRVFRHKDWPEDGKLQWIEKQFRRYGIPHAKMLFYDRSEKRFPNGFMISEFIEGKSAADAIKAGELSTSRFYVEDAKLLEKVHRIKCKKFGYWDGKRLGTKPDFASFYFPRIKRKLDRFKSTKHYDANLAKEVETKVKRLLQPSLKKLKPVLTHGDPGRDNCIWNKEKGLILVDWDNVMSSVWLRDYADLMYWESYAAQLSNVPKTRMVDAQRSFLKGYGKIEFSKKEIERITSAIFIMKAVDLLPYYYFDQRNMPVFRKTRQRLNTLLNQVEF